MPPAAAGAGVSDVRTSVIAYGIGSAIPIGVFAVAIAIGAGFATTLTQGATSPSLGALTTAPMRSRVRGRWFGGSTRESRCRYSRRSDQDAPATNEVVIGRFALVQTPPRDRRKLMPLLR